MFQSNRFSPDEVHDSVTGPSGDPDSNQQTVRNATWAAIVLSAAGLLFVVIGFLLADINSWKDYALLGAPALLFFLAAISIILLRRGRVRLGTGLLLVANLIAPIVEAFLQTGIGWAVFVYALVSSALLIWWAVPRTHFSHRWASTLTALALVLIAVVEWFDSPVRIPASRQLVTFFIVVTVLLGASFMIQAARQTWGRSMRNKLLIAFMAVTVIASSVIGVFVVSTTTNILRNNLERELTSQAANRAVHIGDLLDLQISTLTTLALNETLRHAIETENRAYRGDPAAIRALLDEKDAQWRAAVTANDNSDPLIQEHLSNKLAQELTKYQQAFPDNVEVFVTDVYGGLAGATNRTSDYFQADEEWWQVAYNDGQGGVYIGSPEFDESAGAVGVQIAIPLRDHNGKITGVLRTTYIVYPLATILGEKIGQTDEADLLVPGAVASRIDDTGQYEPLGDEEFRALQAVADQGMVEMEYEGTFSVVIQATVRSVAGNSAVDDLGWVVIFNQSQNEAFAPLNAQIRVIVIVTMIIIAFAIAAAFALSQLLIRPITKLTLTAEAISAGNLDSRAEVTSTDEAGKLATAFNTMTSRLQNTLQGLEQRVAERTQNLELAAEVGRSVSQVRALDVMLKDAAEIIRSRFDLYYTQVYLANPAENTLILQSGTGEVGAQLVARGHRLPIDTRSINGRAAQEKRSVVISDTAASTTFRPNSLLPETRSEMAVPLMVGAKVVGVLDLQSSKAGALSEELLPAYEALAGQLAIAIQNANLLAEVEQARADVESQSRRVVKANWREYLDAVHKPEFTAFEFTANQVTRLEDVTQAAQVAEDGAALSAPIAVSGEPIGILAAEFDAQYQTSQNAELISIVARQVAQHIESLRLLESAERFRAEAEAATHRATLEGWKQYMESHVNESLGYLYDTKEVRPQNEAEQLVETALSLPIRAHEEIVGKLEVAGVELQDDQALELANVVAERLGAHIENLRLSYQTQSALAQSERLFDASRRLNQSAGLQELMDGTVTSLGISEVNRALLATFDVDEKGEVRQLNILANWWNHTGHEVTPLGTRYPLEVIRVMPMFISPVPVFFSDTLNDPRVDATTMELVKRLNLRAVAVLPLHLGTRQIGALILEAEEPHNFSQDEMRLFAALAPQIATAVENRRQFEQAQQQAEREAMLNAIGQKIQSATTVEAVLQIAARELGRALGAPLTVAQLGVGLKKNGNEN